MLLLGRVILVGHGSKYWTQTRLVKTNAYSSFARVVFQNTNLGDVIAPAGWRPWSTAVNGTTNTENVTFAEFDNFGAGSILEEGPRAVFSEQLSSAVAIDTVLGEGWSQEWWVDQVFIV